MNKEDFLGFMGEIHGLDQETLVKVVVPQLLASMTDEVLGQLAFACYVEQRERYERDAIADASTSEVESPQRYEDIRGE